MIYEQWWYGYGLVVLILIVYVPILIRFSKVYWQYLEEQYENYFKHEASVREDHLDRGSGG
ncbi:hypothetical protein DOZ58_10355 [Acetobacterium sp. KB-1]|jgi:hypothetical protein|nr:hypothetical protein DOZ58_10355 [Acetobacterium sp. KB-1]